MNLEKEVHKIHDHLQSRKNFLAQNQFLNQHQIHDSARKSNTGYPHSSFLYISISDSLSHLKKMQTELRLSEYVQNKNTSVSASGRINIDAPETAPHQNLNYIQYPSSGQSSPCNSDNEVDCANETYKIPYSKLLEVLVPSPLLKYEEVEPEKVSHNEKGKISWEGKKEILIYDTQLKGRDLIDDTQIKQLFQDRFNRFNNIVEIKSARQIYMTGKSCILLQYVNGTSAKFVHFNLSSYRNSYNNDLGDNYQVFRVTENRVSKPPQEFVAVFLRYLAVGITKHDIQSLLEVKININPTFIDEPVEINQYQYTVFGVPDIQAYQYICEWYHREMSNKEPHKKQDVKFSLHTKCLYYWKSETTQQQYSPFFSTPPQIGSKVYLEDYEKVRQNNKAIREKKQKDAAQKQLQEEMEREKELRSKAKEDLANQIGNDIPTDQINNHNNGMNQLETEQPKTPLPNFPTLDEKDKIKIDEHNQQFNDIQYTNNNNQYMDVEPLGRTSASSSSINTGFSKQNQENLIIKDQSSSLSMSMRKQENQIAGNMPPSSSSNDILSKQESREEKEKSSMKSQVYLSDYYSQNTTHKSSNNQEGNRSPQVKDDREYRDRDDNNPQNSSSLVSGGTSLSSYYSKNTQNISSIASSNGGGFQQLSSSSAQYYKSRNSGGAGGIGSSSFNGPSGKLGREYAHGQQYEYGGKSRSRSRSNSDQRKEKRKDKQKQKHSASNSPENYNNNNNNNNNYDHKQQYSPKDRQKYSKSRSRSISMERIKERNKDRDRYNDKSRDKDHYSRSRSPNNRKYNQNKNQNN